MTDKDSTKELSPEEKRALNVKKTLEWKLMQDIVGSNAIKQNPFMYGKFAYDGGQETYRAAKQSDDFNFQRNRIYKSKLEEQAQLGIAEEPSMPDNYEVVRSMIRQLKEVQSIAKLGELKKYATDAGAELDFEIPEELKDISEADVIRVAQEKGAITRQGIDMSKLGMKYDIAITLKKNLVDAYERAVALNAGKANYFGDINATGKRVLDVYNKAIKNNGETA